MFHGFRDREEAGQDLAAELNKMPLPPDAVVLALPRGGVPVAYEVARSLRSPLDILVVRKLGVPGHEELAFGAIASGGALFLNRELIQALRLTKPMMERTIEREEAELERRERLYRGGRPAADVRGRTVILVDDGLATGATMHAALEAVRARDPERMIVAVPVAAAETCDQFQQDADEMCVCARTPEPFYAVGIWYRDFSPTTDEEVISLLARADTAARLAPQPA